jgi:hypothetical protein
MLQRNCIPATLANPTQPDPTSLRPVNPLCTRPDRPLEPSGSIDTDALRPMSAAAPHSHYTPCSALAVTCADCAHCRQSLQPDDKTVVPPVVLAEDAACAAVATDD